MFSDSTLTILSNKNNPVVEVSFIRLFSNKFRWFRIIIKITTDVDYLTVDVTFKYKIYEIHTL